MKWNFRGILIYIFNLCQVSWPGITLDARLAQAWILDLLAVGYEFPKLCLGGLGGFQVALVAVIPEIFPLENHWKPIKAIWVF